MLIFLLITGLYQQLLILLIGLFSLNEDVIIIMITIAVDSQDT